jgi:hypothetical protein
MSIEECLLIKNYQLKRIVQKIQIYMLRGFNRGAYFYMLPIYVKCTIIAENNITAVIITINSI